MDAAVSRAPRFGGGGRLAGTPHILGDSDEAMFVAAADGTVLEINAAALRLLRQDPIRAVGSKCYTVLRGWTLAGRVLCAADCPHLQVGAAEGAAMAPIEVRVAQREPTGAQTEFDLQVHRIPLVCADGPLILHLLQDVGARRRQERIGARLEALLEGGPIDVVSLTGREREVFRLMSEGLTSSQIAARLGIRPATARNHANRVLGKLTVTSRVAALTAYLTGPGAATRGGPEDSPPGTSPAPKGTGQELP